MELLLFLLALSLGYCIYKLYLYKQQLKLQYLVAWSVTTHCSSAPSIRPGLDLIDYIHRAQMNLKIPSCYCFTQQSELDFVDLLLKEYQRSITQAFFNHSLQLPKYKKSLSGEQFFMYMLYMTLNQHQCDSYYLNHAMHTKRLSYIEGGLWGVQNYDATYLLSDFALTYYKLYYVVSLFCQNDPLLSQNKVFVDPDSIKKNIDSKQISIWCHS